jgi:PIN domain nuclease of toxin-antitoxin system
MRAVVADTHALLWHLTEPRRLGKAARRAFAAADRGRWCCHVPVVVLIETWLLHERGRLRIDPSHVLQQIADHPGYAILPLGVDQVMEFGALAGIRDPMDRLIVAAARALHASLITADEAFGGHGVATLWD